MSAAKSSVELVDTELRRASSPGFWEMWIHGRFVGMYYSIERARAAARSPYAAAMRRKYQPEVQS